jgi:HSP20 family protein
MANEPRQEVAVVSKPKGELAESRPAQMFSPFDEVERLFDRLMPRGWLATPTSWNWPLWGGLEEAFQSVRIPQMDVIDRDKDILIRVELPGVEKKDLDISVSDSTLVIKGTVSREIKEQKKDYYRSEIAQGNFSRSLSIPASVDSSKINASLKDGILEIVLGKHESMQRRTVEVK